MRYKPVRIQVNDRFARPGPGSHQSSHGFDSSDPFIPERHNSSIYGYQAEAGEGLWHHAIILNVTVLLHSVHRQSVAPTTVSHLHVFFVVINASFVSF